MGRLSFEAGYPSLHTYTHMDRMQRLMVVLSSLDEFDAPPSAIKLTDGGEGDGCVYVHDVETSMYEGKLRILFFFSV
jgi:hypothetical protein